MKIKLNDKVSIDLAKLVDSRLLVQANSGGGKSWAIRRIIEQAFGHVQIIVLDPEGEFTNLREKFDFVYAGKGGDAPVESRSAALLAHRLLELKASAIIDLYELPPQERKHFVKLFCESLVNAPKNLWHDCVVIIDEAHVFAPEKDQAESLTAVIDLASRGRKRGYCCVLATQRPAKLNKDAAAECNNKLIGRATLDIDRKRAGEELGFTSKDEVLSLRDLDPGTFFAFGPAISREVIEVVIGDVKVKPPARGAARRTIPAPSATVRKILAKLTDLPQEAAKEAKTMADLTARLATAKSEITRMAREAARPVVDLDAIDKAVRGSNLIIEREFDRFKQEIYQLLLKTHGHARSTLEEMDILVAKFKKEVQKPAPKEGRGLSEFSHSKAKLSSDYKPVARTEMRYQPTESHIEVSGRERSDLNKGEREILKAVAADPDGLTTEHIAVLTGYKTTSRREYLRQLVAKAFVRKSGDTFIATDDGFHALGSDYQPLPSGDALREHVLGRISGGERKILEFLIQQYPEAVPFAEIEGVTGYKTTSRREYVRQLVARKLVHATAGSAKVSDKLFD